MVRMIQLVVTVALVLTLVACDGDDNNREEVEELKAALAAAQEKVMELEAAQGKVMELEAALEEAQGKVMTLEAALAEAGTSEAELETALAEARDKVMALEAALTEVLAMRWWNALTAEQMVAALYGDEATTEQTAAAQKMYADLDDDTKALVNAASDAIYGDGGHASVGDWWETLDCRLMRIAAGDGNTADPMSPYCAHYPGSGSAKILSEEAKAHVDYVGMALLGRGDPGLFIPYVGRATHGIGTTLEYVTTHEDGTATESSLEFTGYEVYRGRDVLVVQDSQPGSAFPTQYWDLETGNYTASFDADGEVIEEQIPHNGVHAFPMVEGTRPQFVSAYCAGECPPDVGTFWAEFTVEACGIELEVAAGTFTVCRIAATDASWLEGAGITIEDVLWTSWYDPEHDLEVKWQYADPWVDLGVSELSAYQLVE